MKKGKAFIGILILILLGALIGNKVLASELGIVKLSYKILESISNDQTLTMLVKLKARNMGDTPINNVNVSLLSTENMSINVDTIYFGDINSKQTLLSSESFTISVDNSNSQEDPPISKLIWQVEYVNSNDEVVVEEIAF